jgi:hypothetical protein
MSYIRYLLVFGAFELCFMFCLSSSCVPNVASSLYCPYFLIIPSVFSNVYLPFCGIVIVKYSC